MSIQDASSFFGVDYDATVNGIGSSGDGLGVGRNYNYWDKTSSSICVCDLGFFGPDCSLGRMRLFSHMIYCSSLPQR